MHRFRWTGREQGGLLFLQFVETDEGLWAEGVSVVCRNADSSMQGTGHDD